MEERAGGAARKKYVWSLKKQDVREWAQALSGREEQPLLRDLLHSLPVAAVCLLVSMGKLNAGSMPFAMGLFCGCILAGKNVLMSALGCALGALLGGGYVQAINVCLFFFTYAGLCLLRLRLSELSVKLLCFILSATLPLALAESAYEWVNALLSALASALISGLLAGALRVRWKERELITPEEICGLGLLLGGSLLGLMPVSAFGVSTAPALYLALCLLAGYLGGPGPGAAVGAALGAVAAFGEAPQPHLAGGMALCGLLCGLFSGFHRAGSILGMLLGAALSAALDERWLGLEMCMQMSLAALLVLLLPGGFLKSLRNRMNRDAYLNKSGCDARNEARQELRKKLEGYQLLYDGMAQTLRHFSGARQYAAVSAAFGAMAQELNRRVETDAELKRACMEALDRSRIPVLSVNAYREGGELRVALRFRRHAALQHREEAVRTLSAALRCPLHIFSEPEEGGDELLLCPATRYQLLVGACKRASGDGRGPCGDNHLFRELSGGLYMLAISDGMGHGSRACDESRTAVELLEEYLAAGFEPSAAVMGVNDLLLRRDRGEMYATMDLGIVDLTKGRMRLIKIGAVRSYIKRGRELIALSGGALPMGIVDALSPFEGEMQLQEGDMLVMVSDGVADAGGEEEGWLEKEIGLLSLREPRAAAKYLVDKAAERAKKPDDMTVIVARVFKRGGKAA